MQEQEIFSFSYGVQTGSGAHPAFYPVGTEVLFPEEKRPGRDPDNSSPSSVEVKNMWIYTSTPHTSS
jgi:hypothetical protein